ncbi:hypothetical protein [Pajaroellobacter abortibovis]|nr:hypothetical protein [Pajaroellobacter abortibovis]
MIRTIAFALLLWMGCSPKRPYYREGVFHIHDAVFQLGQIPPTWTPLSIHEATIGFRDAAQHASVFLYARCHQKRDDIPLTVLTNHLLLGTTERDIREQQTIPLDGREALFTHLHAKLDGVEMHYEIYVLKKDDCLYKFIYMRSIQEKEELSEAFKRSVTGFRAIRQE